MRVFAIDPGPKTSGVCLLEWKQGQQPELIMKDHYDNHDLIRHLRGGACHNLAIEGIQNYGMAVGNDVFQTLKFIGRIEQVSDLYGKRLTEILRTQIKANICGTASAKDPQVRRAIIARFCQWYDTTESQVQGKKAAPGPLYGVKKHIWSALALALTWFERPEYRDPELKAVV